jgi:hypothetical protein
VARFLVLVVVMAAVAASPTLANQGGHRKGAQADGSRASIQGSATTSINGALIATVRVESTNDGLIQFGFLKVGSNFITGCGTDTVGYMVERKASGGPFICNDYFGAFGTRAKFSVLRAADGSGFRAYLDGSVFAGPYALGFPSNGIAIAVGEYLGNPPPSYNMTFGPSGFTPWQWTSTNGNNWTTVSVADSTFNGGGWIIGAEPSPFNISR